MENFEIIEQKLLGKRDEGSCEDGIIINDDLIAVIDGSTSKVSKSLNGKLGGRLAMEIIKDKLSKMDRSLEPINKLNSLASAIGEFKRANEITFPVIASLIFYDAKYKSIVSYGDCRALVNGELITDEKLADIVLAEKRSKYIHSFLEGGMSEDELLAHDLSREFIMPYLLKQQSLANIEYPALTSNPIKESFVNIYNVYSGDEVVLASDGYPVLKRSLSSSEEYLARVIKNDPLCYKEFKSTKGVYKGNISYDDRAYVRFKIN